METKFNFKSQPCTSREQSERLLALGLKKETADMVHFFSQSLAQDWTIVPLAENETAKNIEGVEIPAWSLGRLWELYWSNKVVSDCLFGCGKYMNPYAKMIAMIEYDIEDGTISNKI